MHGPDGTDYENTTQYLEVVPLQRMVYDHGGHKDRPPLFRVTALFTERTGRTQLDMSMAFATPEIATEMRGFIKKAGGEATWDRLAEYLVKRLAGVEQFFIARTFDAPIARVYEMWTIRRVIMCCGQFTQIGQMLDSYTRSKAPSASDRDRPRQASGWRGQFASRHWWRSAQTFREYLYSRNKLSRDTGRGSPD